MLEGYPELVLRRLPQPCESIAVVYCDLIVSEVFEMESIQAL